MHGWFIYGSNFVTLSGDSKWSVWISSLLSAANFRKSNSQKMFFFFFYIWLFTFWLLCVLNSSVASRGKGVDCKSNSKKKPKIGETEGKIRGKEGKRGKIGKGGKLGKRGKNGKERQKFGKILSTFPLLTERAGYATGTKLFHFRKGQIITTEAL